MKSFFFTAIASLVLMATLISFQTPPPNTWNILKKVKVRSTYDTISDRYKFSHRYTKPIRKLNKKSVTLTGYLHPSGDSSALFTQSPDCFICVAPSTTKCVLLLKNIKDILPIGHNHPATISGILHLNSHQVRPYLMTNVTVHIRE